MRWIRINSWSAPPAVKKLMGFKGPFVVEGLRSIATDDGKRPNADVTCDSVCCDADDMARDAMDGARLNSPRCR